MRELRFVSTGPVRPVWSINMKGRVSANVISSVPLAPVSYPERDHVPCSILNHILPGDPASCQEIFNPDWACGFFCPIGCQQIGRCRPTRRAFIRHLSLLCVLFQYSCLTRHAAAIIDVAFSAHDLGAPTLSAPRGLVGEENVSSKPPRPQSGSSQIQATDHSRPAPPRTGSDHLLASFRNPTDYSRPYRSPPHLRLPNSARMFLQKSAHSWASCFSRTLSPMSLMPILNPDGGNSSFRRGPEQTAAFVLQLHI
jgi:hypothetical protein